MPRDRPCAASAPNQELADEHFAMTSHFFRRVKHCLVVLLLAVSIGCGQSEDQGVLRDDAAASPATQTEPSVSTSTTVSTPEAPDLKYPVPQGSAADLAGFLSEMAVRDARGNTPDEANADLAEIMKSRIWAAERILSIADADALYRLMASEAKLESLRTLALSGQGEQSEFASFAGELSKSTDVAVAQVGRIGQLQHTLDEVRALGVVDTATLLASIREIIDKVNRREHPDLRVLYALSETSHVLKEVDELDTAIEVLQIGAELLLESKGDSQTTLDITNRFARDLEAVGRIEASKALLDFLQARFGDHADPALRTTALAFIQSTRQRWSQIGQPLTVQGDTVEGNAFDAKSLENKVVLLQFWTTFSPSTNARFVELQKLYRRFHNGGFEIVGVCLDEDDAAITAYLTSNQIPWPIIHNRESSSRGSSDPNAQRYGIEVAVTPYSFLADATGSIVDLNPTSDELRDAIPTMLPASEISNGQPDTPNESARPETAEGEPAAANARESEIKTEQQDERTEGQDAKYPKNDGSRRTAESRFG